MNKELELWRFISDRLMRNESVMLLVVAESSGSSPGRQGYKMAVGADDKLCGSIGGGVMEVNLVEQSRTILSVPPADGDECKSPHVSRGGTRNASLTELVHKRNTPNASGMMCSGKQTVIFKYLTAEHANAVNAIVAALRNRQPDVLSIATNKFKVEPPRGRTPNFLFEKLTETDFVYTERLGFKNDLVIIGGGHCALALSELMSKLDFHISIFDDRPELNTIEKNQFADEINIIESYENIADAITTGGNIYVVVMTLGYKSDAAVIRQLVDKNFKYFGVLGSKAKMKTLMNELKAEGYSTERLERIHTPIGLPINSRTPEEIAVSIAAEIIAISNGTIA